MFFSLAGDSDGEEHMLDKLAGLQASDGSLEGGDCFGRRQWR